MVTIFKETHCIIERNDKISRKDIEFVILSQDRYWRLWVSGKFKEKSMIDKSK